MNLQETPAYAAYGLTAEMLDKLARYGDLLLSSLVNVTALHDPLAIERLHFLDSLSLLSIPEVACAEQVVDVGSGGGLPAVVLALVSRDMQVVAVESVRKKCAFIEDVGLSLGLKNLRVECVRAEEMGRSDARGTFDVAVTRAVASLAVVAELCLPLVHRGGLVVAMKGPMSDQERIQGKNAIAILGGEEVSACHVLPFPEAENRWLYGVRKTSSTPAEYPRRAGVPAKRPLGGVRSDGGRRG